MQFRMITAAISLITAGLTSVCIADAPDLLVGWPYYGHPTHVSPIDYGLSIDSYAYRVRLGFENPGVSVLEVQEHAGEIPISQFLYIKHGSKPFAVQSLNDFRGLVKLPTPDVALRFVRLRTNTSDDMLGHWFRAFEVVSSPKVGHNAIVSGMDGELSEKAYKAGGFSAPVVRSVPNGYEITRWVCVFKDISDGGRLQKWKEYVGNDGAYRLIVLLTKPFPALPGTSWMQLTEE